MTIKAIIKKDETGFYYAEVPAMPGCFSQGKTLDEARENIKEAMEGWIEVMNEKAERADKDDIYEVSC